MKRIFRRLQQFVGELRGQLASTDQPVTRQVVCGQTRSSIFLKASGAVAVTLSRSREHYHVAEFDRRGCRHVDGPQRPEEVRR